jgi:hypothetical protein
MMTKDHNLKSVELDGGFFVFVNDRLYFSVFEK